MLAGDMVLWGNDHHIEPGSCILGRQKVGGASQLSEFSHIEKQHTFLEQEALGFSLPRRLDLERPSTPTKVGVSFAPMREDVSHRLPSCFEHHQSVPLVPISLSRPSPIPW